MIGNTIKFIHYDWGKYSSHYGERKGEKTGVVVDAYTDISGLISGSGYSVIGFGESSVSGKTESKRMYKVMVNDGLRSFVTIYDWQLISIERFSNSNNKTQEEKFRL